MNIKLTIEIDAVNSTMATDALRDAFSMLHWKYTNAGSDEEIAKMATAAKNADGAYYDGDSGTYHWNSELFLTNA